MSKVKINIFYAGNTESAVFVKDYTTNILPKVKKYGLDITVIDTRKLSRQQAMSIANFLNAGIFPFALVNDGKVQVYYQKKAQIYDIISNECLRVKEAYQQSKRTGGKQQSSNTSYDDPADFLDTQRNAVQMSMATEKEVSMDTTDNAAGSGFEISDGSFRRQQGAGRSIGSGAVRNNISAFGSGFDDDTGTDGISSDFINDAMCDYDSSEGEMRERLRQAIIDPGADGSESKVGADGVGDRVPSSRLW